MLKFRKIKAEDIAKTDWDSAALSPLLPAPHGSAFLQERLAAGDTLILLYDDGVPAGFLQILAAPTNGKPRALVIENILLLPAYRRHGLGRMLMVLAADFAASQQVWFLAGKVPPEAEAFADAIHMVQTAWYDDLRLLDLSDVEGLRHG